MKVITYESWDAISEGSMGCRLRLDPDCTTLPQVRECIDRVNGRAVAQGYSAERFVIVRTMTRKVFSDQGAFVSSSSSSRAVEVYG